MRTVEKKGRQLYSTIRKTVKKYNLVAKGCGSHPRYRGKCKPRKFCPQCWKVHNAAKSLGLW